MCLHDAYDIFQLHELRFGSYKLMPFVFYINHERVVKLTEYVENYSKDLLLTVVVLVSVDSFVQS